jgi:hypothetical protein
MADPRRPVTHLLRGSEELLRAASEWLAVLRERGWSEGPSGLERTVLELADQIGDWLTRGEQHAVVALREALRLEVLRWELRAGEDPAARRVHALFQLLLDLVEDAEEPKVEPRERKRPGPKPRQDGRSSRPKSAPRSSGGQPRPK